MDDRDCMRIARDANIQYEHSIDIFYNKHLEFDKYESNLEAAYQLKLFFPFAEKIEKGQKLTALDSILGIFPWNKKSAQTSKKKATNY